MGAKYPYILTREQIRQIEADMQAVRDNWNNVKIKFTERKENEHVNVA